MLAAQPRPSKQAQDRQETTPSQQPSEQSTIYDRSLAAPQLDTKSNGQSDIESNRHQPKDRAPDAFLLQYQAVFACFLPRKKHDFLEGLKV